MKEKQQTRTQLASNQKMRDVNVTQHYCPNQIHNKSVILSPSPCAREPPSANNTCHLHPVYKFVDNYLSNVTVSKRPVGSSSGVMNKEVTQNKLCRKVERPCNPVRYIGSDSTPKNYPHTCSHRASCQTMNNKQDNIQNNLRNLSCHCCSARTTCLHKPQDNPYYITTVDCGSPSPLKQSSMPTESDNYVNQLKKEIQQGRAQICQLITTKSSIKSAAAFKLQPPDVIKNPVDDEYVRKLKEELACKKNKCICEARNIINELQNEITGFRLKAKSKYSSSCSDIGAGDQAPTLNILLDGPKTELRPCNKRDTNEKQQPVRLSCSPQGESPRWTECKTLWQSKKSFLSPANTVAHPVSQAINFEAKLEEAHSLIEKVRATLNDLGQGISKSSEHKNMPPNADCRCLNIRLAVEECALRTGKNMKDGEVKQDFTSEECGTRDKVIKKNDKIQENDRKRKEIKVPTGTVKVVKKDEKLRENDKKEEVLKKGDNLQKICTPKKDVLLSKQLNVAKQVEIDAKKTTECKNRPCKTVEQQKAKLEVKPEQADVTNVKDNRTIKKESEKVRPQVLTKKENEPLEIITIQPVKDVVSTDDIECEHNPEDMSESMDLLQEKLKAISEEDFTVPGNQMEGPGAASSQTPTDQLVQVLIQKEHPRKESVCPPEFQEESLSILEQGTQCINQEVSKDNETQTKKDLQDPVGVPPNERVSRKSSDKSATSVKSAKLSIQMMPPVSIRAGLVMQKTLHLSIKPTGSVTNTVDANQVNVGYKEIKMNPEAEEPTLLKCPNDCKNTDGGYCKPSTVKMRGVLKDIEGTHQFLRGEKDRRQSLPIQLGQDALKLYKSFQILDDYQDGRSAAALETVSGNRRTEQLEQMESIDTVVKIATALKQSRTAGRSTSIGATDTPSARKLCKNPWVMGFYKSKATQCSDMSLPDEIPALSNQEVSDVSSTREPSVPENPPIPEKGIYESIIAEAATESKMGGSVPPLENPTPSLFSEQEMQEIRLDIARKPVPIEEQPTSGRSSGEKEVTLTTPSPGTSSAERLTRLESLKSDKTAPSLSDSSSEESVRSYDNTNKDEDSKSSKSDATKATSLSMVEILGAPQQDPDKPITISSKGTVSNADTAVREPSLPEKPNEKKEDFSASGGSSSSGSSYNIQGSITSPRAKGPAPLQSFQHVQRPNEPTHDTTVRRSSLKTPKTSIESENASKLQTEEMKDEDPSRESHKKKGFKKADKVEVEAEVSKESKPATNNAHKMDESVQVSLETSETESSTDSFDEERERANTIAYFIKGLTGTSQDQLEKLRSNPSFPKADQQSYSKIALRRMSDRRPSDKRTIERQMSDTHKSKKEENVDKEEVVETLDYVKPRSDVTSDEDLSEGTKMQRLREFQKLHGAAPPDDQKEDERIVMRVKAEKGSSVEGEHSRVLSKRQLPFYRRVLGRIIEPSSKRVMPKSLSDAYPIEESISEGEMKCKNSRSIGEISSYKYFDRNKIGKAGVKYLKKHLEEVNRKEMRDPSLRIARQRTQYNNWVTYYLQKQQTFSLMDDSSSSSPVSRSKK